MSSSRTCSGRRSGAEADISQEVRQALARTGRVRAGQGLGCALVVVAALAVLAERALKPGVAPSLAVLAPALAAALFGMLLASRAAPMTLPPGTVHDPSMLGELVLAAMRFGGSERDTLLDVLCCALAFHRATPPRAWEDGDLVALKALLSRCDPSRPNQALLIETTLGFFALHGGPRELEFARWLSTGTGGSALEAGIREAAAACAERMEKRLAEERQAGTLVRPAAAPGDALLRPAEAGRGEEERLLRPMGSDGDDGA